MKMILKVSLDEFRQYLRILDERLSDLRKCNPDFLSRIEFPVEIYAMGGFSLMYYGLRFSGTEDIDSAKKIRRAYKKACS